MNPPGGSDPGPVRPAIVSPTPQVGVSLDAPNPLNTGPIGAAGSLDTDLDSTQAVIDAEERQARQQLANRRATESRGRFVKFAVIAVILLIGLVLALLRHNTATNAPATDADASQRFPVTSIPLANIAANSPGLSVTNTQSLSINGQLNVNNSLVIAPTTRPNGAVTGQLYYDQTANQLSYYNGSSFQTLLSGSLPATVGSLDGATGSLKTGNGLGVSGQTLRNTGVLTLQGESGNVTLSAGPGIVVNGTTLSNSGLLSLGGQGGDILLGSGLSLNGKTLNATGNVNGIDGTGSVSVTNDGNGNYTIGLTAVPGTGTVTSSGTAGSGKIAMFTGVQNIEQSIIGQTGSTITIGGSLRVTGSTTLDTPLTVADGGTGATNAAAARSNLNAAGSGVNNDITQLTGLTTALSVAQGGTGVGVLPANGVLIGNGAGAIIGITSGAAGQCLVSGAGAPSFQACPGAGGVASLNGLSGAVTLQGVSGGSITNGAGTITINDATSAIKGLASFNSTNLTVVNGNVNTVQNIGQAANPTFAGLTLTNALSVANGGTGLNTLTASELLFAGSTSSISQLTNGTSGQCLVSNGASIAPSFQACTGAGGVASLNTLTGALTISNTTGAGSTITINNAKADGTTKGIATFNSTNFTDNGSGLINTKQDIAPSATPSFNGLTLSNALSVANGGTGLASLVADELIYASTSGTIGQISPGTTGQCLTSGGAGVAPSWQNCPGSGGGGVTSVNGLTGVIVLDNATGATGHITIANAKADGTTKGIAAFNSTNFKDNGSGVINTVQDISVSSAPSFGQLIVTSTQATNDMFVVNNTAAAPSGNLLNLEVGGASKLSVAANGNLTGGLINGQTISSSANFTGALTVAGTLTVSTIANAGALTVGVGGQTFTLQGNASSTITSTNGTNTATVGFQNPSANVTYTFPDNVAGSYDICTTQGNCAGSGGGVTTSGGTANTLAKFTSGNAIGNSIITDNGSTVTIGGTLAVNTITPTAALTVGAAGQNLTLQGAGVSLKANAAGITNTLTFAVPSESNKTITLPNASGTVAVNASGPLNLDSAGNLTCPTCLTSGSGGGTAGVTSLNGATGTLTLQGSDAASFTTVGTTITVSDASSTVKGLAKFNSADLTVTSGSVDTIQGISSSSSPQFAGLTLSSPLAVSSGGTGASTLTSNGVVIGHGTSALTAVTGANGQCLMMVTGTPTFGTCPGAGGGSVNSVNGLSGTLTINNVTTDGVRTITINNATATGVKGIATFNGTNFKDNGSGTINTIQDIAASSTPSFAGLNLTSSPLGVSSGGTGLATMSANELLFASSASSVSQLANGTAGQCLVSNGVGSAPSFQTCTGAGGVSSIDGLSGTITLDNSSGAAGHITINNAMANGATAGIATFNSTDFRDNGAGLIDTIQGIATSSTPQFAGLTLSSALTVGNGGTGLNTLTAFGILYASSTSTLSQLGVGTSGQCLISNGAGSAPSFQTCTGAGGVSSLNSQTGAVTLDNATGSGGHVTIANATANGTKGIATFNTTDLRDNGAGLIDTIQGISTSSTPQFAGLTLTNALTVGNGGTGLQSLTANELLFASSTSAISQLPAGTSGQCLMSNGVGSAPSFQTCTGAGGVSSVDGLSGSITLDNSSGAAGHITIANAAADGATKGIAAFNGTNFTATGGVINTVQGIAASSTPSFAGLTLTSTALGVSSGGTGLAALSAFGILYASSTSAISQLGTGTSGQCLMSNGAGAAASWQACPGSGGGGITGSGTSGKLALFNGTNTVTSSDITDTAGTSVGIAAGVSLNVQGVFQVKNSTSQLLLGADTTSATVSVGATVDPLASTINIATSTTGGQTVHIADGAISAGTNTVTIGTGATTGGKESVTIGSNIGASIMNINAGSGNAAGDLNIQTAAGGIINVGTAAVNNKVINIGSVANTANNTQVNIATTGGNATQAVYIGSTASANNIMAIRAGSSSVNDGAISIDTAAGGAINIASGTSGANSTIAIGGATTTGKITIGGTGTTGNIVVGQYSGASTSTIQIGAGATTGTQTINIGTGSTGTGKDVVNIGSTNGTSTATIQGDGVKNTLSSNGDVVQSTNNSPSAFQVQNANGDSLLDVDASTGNVNVQGGLSVASVSNVSNPTVSTSTSGGNLPANTDYCYSIVAWDHYGNSTEAVDASPCAITTGAGSTNSNTVSWTASSGPVDHYTVYRTLDYSTWVSQDVANTVTSLTDTQTSTGWTAASWPSSINWTAGTYMSAGSVIMLDSDQGSNTEIGYNQNYSQLYLSNWATDGEITMHAAHFNFQATADSTTAFEVQNAGGNSLLAVDTADDHILIGSGAAIAANETLTVQSAANSYGIMNTDGTVSVGTWLDDVGNQALIGTHSSSSLGFFTAGNAGDALAIGTNGSAVFQNYSDSSAGFTVQNSSSQALFGVNTANNCINIGLSANCASSGAKATVDADIVSNGTGLGISANGLTTGYGASISSSSALQTAGSLFNVSDTAQLVTNGSSITGNLVNVGRNISTNITSGSGTATPTLDQKAVFSQSSHLSPWSSSTFTIAAGHSNYYIFVALMDENYCDNTHIPTVSVGGTALTLIDGKGNPPLDTAPNECYFLFGHTMSTTGSQSITVTDSDTGDWYNMEVDDWYNVNQSTPYGTETAQEGGQSGTADPIPAPSISSSAWTSGHVIVEHNVVNDTNCDIAPSTGQTAIYGSSGGICGNAAQMYAAYKTSVGGSQTLSWSGGPTNGTGYWIEMALDLVGATASPNGSVTGPVASFSDNCTTTAGTCTDSGDVMLLQQQYAGATGAVLSIQNAGSGDMLDMSAGGTLVASISDSGNLSLTGTITGGVYNPGQFTDNATASTTHTITTDAFAYDLSSTSGNGGSLATNTLIVSTFNITGLPNVDGTMATFSVTDQKSSSTNSYNHEVIVQINGTAVSTLYDVAPGSFNTSAVTVTHNFILVRMNGTWTPVGEGYNPGQTTSEASVSGADYAEWIPYSTATVPQPGDVLTVGDNATSVKDSTTPYDSHLIGVVSTNPYEVGGADDGHSVILALTGRVPVKVSTENGPIEPGDPLTSSSTPGVAMKATRSGQIIGTALEAYDGTQNSNEITVQLHPGYANPDPGSIQGNADISGELYVGGEATIDTLSANTATIGTLTVNVALSTAGITINGHIVTGGGTPTVAAGTTAGTGAVPTVTGTDTSGKLTVTAGTGVTAGNLANLTFHTPYSAAPNVTVTAGDSNAAQIQQYVTPTATGFSLNTATGAGLTPGQTYTFYYQVLQ